MSHPSSNPLVPTEKIWRNGSLIPWEQASVHVLSHAISYASAVFEGIRCYDTASGPAALRLRDHTRRLIESAKIYRMELPYTAGQLADAVLDLVRANKMKACYVRLIALRGYGSMGVHPGSNPTDVFMACWEWGSYLGEEAVARGADVCVSSWNRMAPNTLPALSKAAANYMNSQLIKMEAAGNGFDEGIALDPAGYVSEGSGENVFVVRAGKLLTPALGASVLEGITRKSVFELAEYLRIPVIEAQIPREMLYVADEVFLAGTAAEISPVRSVDRIQIGAGSRGPLTERLQCEFFAVLKGLKADRFNWLTPVNEQRRLALPICLPSFVRIP